MDNIVPKSANLRGGSRKGIPNKTTKAIKDMILGALDAKGGQAWLEDQMDKNPGPFMALLGKILPQEVKAELTGKNGNPMESKLVVEFVRANDPNSRKA